MNIKRALSPSFLENPFVARQLSTQLTGPRLGMVFALVAGALLCTDAGIFIDAVSSAHMDAAEVGGLLHFWNCALLYGLLALLLPLRLSGTIDGPRADRSFDQVVVSGMSPLAIHFGSWAVALVYMLAIFLVSLPFTVHACLLGGVSPAAAAWSYAVLAIYSNLIIAATLGLATLEREMVTVPVTIGLFWIAGIVSFAPVPASVGELTPVRVLARVTRAGTWLMGRRPEYFTNPILFFTDVPLEAYAFVLWAFVGLAPFLWIFLGPGQRFLPGLDNFGAVTLPGDRKRKLFRKLRQVLARKVEIRFLYENRPRWLNGLELPLKMLLGALWVFFLWAITLGHVFEGSRQQQLLRGFYDGTSSIVAVVLTGLVALLGLFALTETRGRLSWKDRIGRWEIPRGWILTAFAVLMIACWVGIHFEVRAEIVEETRATFSAKEGQALEAGAAAARAPAGPQISPPVPPGRSSGYRRTLADLERHAKDWRELVLSVALFLWNFHLLGKVLGRIIRSTFLWRVALFVYSGAVLVSPILILVGLQEGWAPGGLFPLSFFSPMTLGFAQEPSIERFFKRVGFDPAETFARHMECQLAFTAVLILLLALAWIVRRIAGRRAAPAGAPATAAAALGLALLLGSTAARAEGEEESRSLPLAAELTRGFEGKLFLGSQNVPGADFFTLVLENKSDRAVRGTFRRVEPQGGSDITGRRAFEAPARTKTALRWVEEGAFPWLLYGPWGVQLVLEAPGGTLAIDVPPLSLWAVAGPKRQGYQLQGATEVRLAYLVVGEDGRLPPGSDKEVTWVSCKPLFLPEDSRAYGGTSAVFLASMDLSRWTRGQRQALYDHVRRGGSVMFFGPFDPGALKGTGPWERVLAPRSLWRGVRSGVDLTVVDFEEGGSAWLLAGPEGDPPQPLLTTRSLGVGRIGHLSFDLASTGVAETIEKRRGFWSDLEAWVPGSFLPLSIEDFGREDELLDFASLFAVLGYFAAYLACVGPGVFIIFRKKARRRWLPAAVALIPAAFAAGILFLNAFFHLRPSYATLAQADIFGPGAREGVTLARLRVRSSGRQGHTVRVEGLSVSAASFDFLDPRYARPYGRGRGGRDFPDGTVDPERAESGRLIGDGGPLEISTFPWGEASVDLVGDASRREPVLGKVLYEKRIGDLLVEVSGLDASDAGGGAVLVLLNLTGADSSSWFAIAPEDLRGGSMKKRLPWPGGTKLPCPMELSGLRGTRVRLGISSSGRRAAFLVMRASRTGLKISSDDLRFEREVQVPEGWGSKVRDAGSLIEKLAAHHSDPVTEKDGRFYRSLQTRLLVQELPLEVE